jgi:hypothetical protein
MGQHTQHEICFNAFIEFGQVEWAEDNITGRETSKAN